MLDDLLNEIIDKAVEKAVISTLEKIKEKDFSSNIQEVMNTNQLSEYLGISIHWVYKNVKDIPHEKRGKKTIFRKSAIDSWIQQKKDELSIDKDLNSRVSKSNKSYKVV